MSEEREIRVRISPTEDRDSVMRSVHNLFPDAIALETGEPETLIFRFTNIQTLSRRIAEQNIRDTVRAILLRSIRGSVMLFHLNKQAALSGKVNFTDGNSPLGDIEVRIRGVNSRELLDIIVGGAE